MRFRFDDIELDGDHFELRRAGRLVSIQPKALELLLLLVRNRDRLVAVDEILAAVWPGVVVTPSSLKRAVSLARRAIGDDGSVARKIATTSRRGYRFIAPVTITQEGETDRGSWNRYVGRNAMLARLGASLDDAFNGHGRIILLAGEPGIGKTKTAEWIVDRARDSRAEVVTVWGIPTASPTFWAWTCVLRRLADASPESFDRLMPNQRAALTSLSSGGEAHDSPSRFRGSETARFQAYEGMSAVLRQVARDRPFLIVLDDLHAADAESIQMLEYVGRSLGSIPGAIVATLRERDAHITRAQLAAIDGLLRLGGLERWALTGLTGSDLSEYIAQKAGTDVPENLRLALERQTNGNPLLVDQSIRSIESTQLFRTDLSADEWANLLPQGILHLISPKLRQLSGEAVDLLGVASVIGLELDPDLLRRCSPHRDGFEEAIAQSLEQGLLLRDDSGSRLRFPHALIRGAVHEALVPGARESRALHARIHSALEEAARSDAAIDGGLTSELARHACAAVPAVDPMKAAALAERAAEQSDRLFDFEGAATWCERGLEILADVRPIPLAERAALTLRLAHAQVRTQGLERARATFLSACDAARACGRADLLAMSALGLANRPNSTGQADGEVSSLLEESLSMLVDPEHEPLRVRASSRLAAEIRYDDPALARRLADRSLAAARALLDPEVLSQTLEDCTFLQWSQSDPAAWIALNSELAVQARLANDLDLAVSGHKGCVSGALELGDIATAARETRACERIATDVPTPYARWWVEVLSASRALISGDFEDAERRILESMRIADRIDSPEVGIEARAQICYLRVEQGRAAEIVEAAREHVRLFPRQPTWRGALARILLADGQLAEARQAIAPLVASRFEDVPRDRGWLATHALSADVVASAGDASAAALIEERLRPFAGLTTVLGSAIYYGPVAHYLGMLSSVLGRYDEAIAHYDEALRAEQKAGASVFSLRTRIGRARAYHLRDGAGDRSRAMQGLREALGASEARPYALVAREARELAVLLGMRDGHGSAPARAQRRPRGA
ncbi:MAG: AAA family ATPase [Deltaproteobacteria bacterium]|nr:AAA family ATPase [Deltaproteobacteria bacterium]